MSSFAREFILTMTAGKIDINIFEKQMETYRTNKTECVGSI